MWCCFFEISISIRKKSWWRWMMKKMIMFLIFYNFRKKSKILFFNYLFQLNLKKRVFWFLFLFEKCLFHLSNIQNFFHQNKVDHFLKQNWRISRLNLSARLRINLHFSKEFRNQLSFENKIFSIYFLILCFSILFRLISR